MIYTLENNLLRVQINSAGAELWSILDKRDGTEHIWQGDPSVWDRRAPNLFPFCGRLKGNQYINDGKVYNATIHGFSRDYDHKVSEQTKSSITFSLTENEETLAKYPFSFCLKTYYELKEDQLGCYFQVENTNKCVLPFSIGYHTGYMCPFDNMHSIEDYSLVFEKKETSEEILCDENGLITGKTKPYLNNEDLIPLHNKLFNGGSFILTGLKSEYVSIVENSTGREIKIQIKDFPYVVFWSVPDKIPFVCIEPWFGLPDKFDTDGQFSQKQGIQKISEGEYFNCAQKIQFK